MIPQELLLKSSLATAVILSSLALGWRCLRSKGHLSRNPSSDPASQRRISHDLSSLDSHQYHFYANLQIPSSNSALDGVIVSPYGVFLIHALPQRGWIQGNEKELNWIIQSDDGHTFLTNPILQAQEQAAALARILSIPQHFVHPIVLLTGEASFRSRQPEGVIDRNLAGWITRHIDVVFTEAQRHRICYHLDFRHHQSLHASSRHTHLTPLSSHPTPIA